LNDLDKSFVWCDVTFDRSKFFVRLKKHVATAADVLELKQCVSRFSAGLRLPAIIDGTNGRPISSEGRKIFFNDLMVNNFSEVALVVKSNMAVHFARIYCKIFDIPSSFEAFESIESATQWITRAKQTNPTQRKEILQTESEYYICTFDPLSRLLHFYCKIQFSMNVTIGKGLIADFMKLTDGRTDDVDFIFDNSLVEQVSLEVVRMFAELRLRRLAVVSNSFLSRSRTNVVLGIASPDYPVKVFSEHQAAAAWLAHGKMSMLPNRSLPGFFRRNRKKTKQAYRSKVKDSLVRIMQGDFSALDSLEKTNPAKDSLEFLVCALGRQVETQVENMERVNLELNDLVRLRSEQLQEQQKKVFDQARLAELGRFAAGVAHEVNNPLGVILATVELLQRQISRSEMTPKDLQVRLNSVSEMCNRISQIVKTIRNISRDSSTDPNSPATFAELMRDSLVLIHPSLRKSHVKLIVEDNCTEIFPCRKGELAQVLINLIINAKDAVENLPTEDRWIKVRCEKLNEHIQFVVSNGGPSIPDEIRRNIMTPFFTTKPFGQGTGLGLSLSQAIARQHKGSLRLLQGQPTTFVFEVPAVDPDAEQSNAAA